LKIAIYLGFMISNLGFARPADEGCRTV